MIIKNILKNDSSSCPHCAAPALTVICRYCGQPTGLEQDIAIASMEYPVIDYKNAHYDRKVYLTFTALSLVFGFFAILLPKVFFTVDDTPSFVLLMGILCGIVSIGMFLMAVKYSLDADKTRKLGKEYTALVMGEVLDKEYSSGTQGNKTIKLILRTNKGYRIILHKTGYEETENFIQNKAAVRIRYWNKKYVITDTAGPQENLIQYAKRKLEQNINEMR